MHKEGFQPSRPDIGYRKRLVIVRTGELFLCYFRGQCTTRHEKNICTMQHVHKLSKHGRKLILRDLTAPRRLQTGYIWGLLPVRKFAAEETRQLSPS